MNVIRFFVKYWRKIGLKYAGFLFGTVFILSIANGLAHTGLLALISNTLKEPVGQSTVSIPLFTALCLTVPLTLFLSENLLIYLGNRVIYALHVDFCKKILATPLRRLEEIGLPKLQGVMTEDVRNISNAMLGSMMVTMSLTVIFGCLGYLGWLSWKLLLLFCGFLVVGLAWYQILSEKAFRAFQRARKNYDHLLGAFRSLSEGVKELKLNFSRRHSLNEEKFAPAAAGYRDNLLGANVTLSFAGATSQGLYFILIGLVIFWAPNFKNMNDVVLAGGTLVILYLMKYIFMSIGLLGSFFSAGASIKNIEALELSLTEIGDTGAEPLKKAPFKELRLTNVTHSYYNDEHEKSFTLGPLNLSFTPGQITILKGGNGSGKTTLAKILCGLYSQESGVIQWNGEDITDHNRDTYRQKFSAVFLDFFLFDKLLGLDMNELDTQARNYLSELELDHKITIQNGVLSSLNLSGGQKKRLALLSAYLEDRPFYIFDEWASDQDPAFRDIFYTRILPDLKKKGKAILVITHDQKYTHIADRILTSDYGQLELEHM